MTYLTTNFYLIGGTLCVGASLFMFSAFLRTKQVANLSLAFVFFWIGLHSYAFALPTIIHSGDLKLLAFGYIVGIGMIFLTMLSGIEVQKYMTRGVMSKYSVIFASFLITALGIAAIGLMVYDFRLPIISERGIIIWNINPFAAWIIGLSAFFYGLIWGYVFYKAALLVNEAVARYKMMVMSADGFIIGSVALMVHTSSNEIQTLVGHTLFLFAGIITLGIYFVPKKLFQFR